MLTASLLFSSIGGSVEASSYYEDQAKKIEERIDDVEKRVLDYKKNRVTLERDKEVIDEELDRVGRAIKKTQDRYSEKKKESKRVKDELIRTYEEIRKSEAELASREDEFRERVQSMHQGNTTSIVDVVVSASSFTDLVSRVVSYKQIVEKDNQVIEDYLSLVDRLNEQREKSERLMEKVTLAMDELSELKGKLLLDREKVKMLKREKELESMSVDEKIDALLKDRDSLIKAKKDLADEKKRFEAVLATTRVDVSDFESDASVEKEIKVGRMFITPTKGRFTSPYGNRQNPTGPGIEFHTGIDIANRIGTPIHAIADGVVSKVQSSGAGYGNVLFVDHVIEGKKYISVYAHLDAFAVSKGEKVEQGQIIALMGTTGRSTGPHLHFEIRETSGLSDTKGRHVNPMIYVGKGTDKIVKVKEVDEKKKAKAKDLKEELDEIKSLKELEEFKDKFEKEKEDK